MQGYQRRPCHSTPAPGGSDRYSLSMTAEPFCIRKAILIHEPINTDTSGFAPSTPPPLFRCLFCFFFFLSCALGEKNSSKVLVLITGSALCQAWWQKQWRVSGKRYIDAGVLSWQAPSVAANQAVLRPPAERMASALCCWDNQTTPPPPSWRLPLLNGLNIDHSNPENGVIIFSMCHYRSLSCFFYAVEGHLWQIYISVISHSERPAGLLFLH